MGLVHDAAALNMVDLLGKLLQAKASVTEVEPKHGRTPLHFAAEKGHVEAVRLLLGFGARRDALDFYGMTPIEIAAEQGHRRVLAILMGQDPGDEPAEPPSPPPPPDPELEHERIREEYNILEDGRIEFPCPYCRDVLRVPGSKAGQRGRCPACREVIIAPHPRPESQGSPVEFEPLFVKSHMEAARLLFEKLLPMLRAEDPTAILGAHKQIARAWRSADLIQGATPAIRAIAEKNLKIITALSDFEELELDLDMEGVTAMQAIGHCVESTRPIGIRIWRSTERLFICGGSDFIAHP